MKMDMQYLILYSCSIIMVMSHNETGHKNNPQKNMMKLYISLTMFNLLLVKVYKTLLNNFIHYDMSNNNKKNCFFYCQYCVFCINYFM